VPGADAVEASAAAAAADAEAAFMLEVPKTETSVGAAAAEETEEGDGVACASTGIVLAELTPMTDTSVGTTKPDVSTVVDEDCPAEVAELVGEAFESVDAVDC